MGWMAYGPRCGMNRSEEAAHVQEEVGELARLGTAPGIASEVTSFSRERDHHPWMSSKDKFNSSVP